MILAALTVTASERVAHRSRTGMVDGPRRRDVDAACPGPCFSLEGSGQAAHACIASIRPRRRRHESRAVSSAEEHLFFRGRSCGCLQTLVIRSKPDQKPLKLACIAGLGHMHIEALFECCLPASSA
jgi:hypothetical protein